MSSEIAEKMAKFYNQSPLAQKLAAPLKEGAVAEVEFEDDPDTYMMIKEKGRSVFKKGKPEKPQVYFKFSKEAVEWMLEIQGEDQRAIEEYVDRFGTCILDPTPTRWIKFKLCTNVLTGARMGYFNMMMLGGRKALDLTLKLGIKVPRRFMK